MLMCKAWEERKRLHTIAKKYQDYAHNLYERGRTMPPEWDCDQRLKLVMELLDLHNRKTDNILLDNGKVVAYGDFVIERGICNLLPHIRIVMRGGFIVDAGTDNKKAGFERTWPLGIEWSITGGTNG